MKFTKDDIENIKQELNMFPQDNSVTVSKSMILFLVNEISYLQGLISAYENDLVLLDVTEKLKQVQARVQEAEKRIAELEQERRWISIKEKPDHENNILIYDGELDMIFMGSYNYFLGEYIDENGFEIVSASYWQPLPQPPQESE